MSKIEPQKICGERTCSMKVPVWLIGHDSGLLRETRNVLNGSRLLPIDSCCLKWQTAAQHLKRVPEHPPRVCVVNREDDNEKDEFKWMSLFKSFFPSIAMILLLNDLSDENLLKALSMGLSGYLMLPSSPTQILTAVRSILEGQIAMSPAILEQVRTIVLPKEPSRITKLLTTREKEILKYVVDGYSTQEIAGRLFVSYHTVDSHLKNVYRKLEVRRRSSLVSLVLREHILF